MSAPFFLVVSAWELGAIVVTLVLSSYLISNLLAAIFLPYPSRRYSKHPSFPMVSVVIPVFNEPPAIVRASLASWRAVRYPAFEIIIADDSTLPLELDEPSIRVIRRENREGFKGGALRNVFDHLDPRSEWMVVFDADFHVDPDVLVRFSEHYRPGVGAVQGFQSMGRNDPPRYLTRFSEAYHVVANVLLAGRYRLRGFVGVQGTVESYRVEAIRSIGGIAPYSTANEDLDTTFRLRKGGWKIVYDPRIVGKGVAPETYKVFFVQNTRWTATTVREYRRHWGSFLRSPTVPWVEKFDSALFLLTWTNSLVVTPTLLFLPWALVSLHLIPLWLSVLITILPLSLFTLPVLTGASAKLGLTGWVGYYILLLPGYIIMFRACLLGLFTEPGFTRTLKESTPSGRARPRGSVLMASAVGRPALRAYRPGQGTLHRLVCSQCGNVLGHREVLFYAVGALDVPEVTCRRCVGRHELRVRRPSSAPA
ncbi:MAG TPA: glycosyltransferase family 2 protein [Thermoplasmata archaeon]|nr:glycosyltransferase family 2 protein [Thermoplasmata archaeon]